MNDKTMTHAQNWIDRFWSKVDKSMGENACWKWRAYTDKKGYGYFHVDGKFKRSNRVSYSIKNGEIPIGLFVCHSCDNPSCVNPSHLFVGTPKDNALDRNSKNRAASKENHGRSKLTLHQVNEIRNSKLPERELGRIYGIHGSHAGDIKRGKAWKL